MWRLLMKRVIRAVVKSPWPADGMPAKANCMEPAYTRALMRKAQNTPRPAFLKKDAEGNA